MEEIACEYLEMAQATGEQMKKLLLISAVAASTLMASGYKIPEQSLNSTALAGAYVSNASTADAAYYNPANMAFMSDDTHLELNLMYIGLSSINFEGSALGAPTHSAESESENFVIPQIYLVSAPIGEDEDIRLGLSLNAPAGLSKRWETTPESYAAQEFTLKVIEVNPTMSYRFADSFSVAVGMRFVYSSGIISTEPTPRGYLDLEGDSWDLGYNLALAYKPFDIWGMALTYRSNIDLTVEGGQGLPASMAPLTHVPGNTSIPLPAVATFATDLDITDSTNIELVYERVFWSAYDELDIQLDYPGPALGGPGTQHVISQKDWKDTNTIRLGLTQGLGDTTDLMLGFAYDETPVPEENIGFELPDSDAYIGSIGLRWAASDSVDIGAAVLYDYKTSRTVEPTVENNGIDGEFTNASALIVSLGLGYKF